MDTQYDPYAAGGYPPAAMMGMGMGMGMGAGRGAGGRTGPRVSYRGGVFRGREMTGAPPGQAGFHPYAQDPNRQSRKPVVRKTIDFNASVIRQLEVRPDALWCDTCRIDHQMAARLRALAVISPCA